MFKWIAGLFGGKSKGGSKCCCGSSAKEEVVNGKEIGRITHYYGHLNVGIIELTGSLSVGDKIRIKGHTSDLTQPVASLQIEHANVSSAKAGDHIGIKVSGKVHPHDKVYKV